MANLMVLCKFESCFWKKQYLRRNLFLLTPSLKKSWPTANLVSRKAGNAICIICVIILIRCSYGYSSDSQITPDSQWKLGFHKIWFNKMQNHILVKCFWSPLNMHFLLHPPLFLFSCLLSSILLFHFCQCLYCFQISANLGE